MDEQELRRLLGGSESIAPADEGARERAIARAVAEFERVREERSKSPQGFAVLGRLTDGFNKIIRRRQMNRRIIIGGLGTAFAAVLAVGVGLHQFPFIPEQSAPPAEVPAASVAPSSSSDTWTTTPPSPSEPPQIHALPVPVVSPPVSPTVSNRSKVESGLDMRRREADEALDNLPFPISAVTMASGGFTAASEQAPSPSHSIGRDQFPVVDANPVRVVSENPVSTFSVDVDTASYAFMRGQIQNGWLPQKDAIRIEEMINYFTYHYPLPENRKQPFRPTVSVLPSPWKPSNQLIHIGIKGFDIAPDETPRSNLVFLLDVSGSMGEPNKLPLVKKSLGLLLGNLNADDSIAIVVYAGAAGTVLEPTPVREKAKILAALERLEAGGSTAGAEGIRRAYQLAESRFDKDAVNRVILATDGDFNVGITNPEELKGFIERKRDTGIFLSVLGFGYGNLNDRLMQELAQNGNGVAAYIDTLHEARKVLVEEASSTLFPIAKDVKIQVEFNPAVVAEYRLIGYETRALNREDFNNDAVDAGDIGAGHSVTAIYEITPVDSDARLIDEGRYQQTQSDTEDAQDASESEFANEYAFLKIRYKLPDENKSNLITTPITTDDEFPAVPSPRRVLDCAHPAVHKKWQCRGRNAGWASAVAAFAQLLKGGQYTGAFGYDEIIALAEQHKGADKFGYRAEFIQLVRLAKSAAALQAQ